MEDQIIAEQVAICYSRVKKILYVIQIQWLKIGMVVYIGSVNFSYMYAYFYKAIRKEC